MTLTNISAALTNGS